MNRKPISDPQRRWLEEELAEWREDGLVTAEQAERLADRYETGEDADRRKRSTFVFALQGLAALLTGLAVLLLIGFNWEDFPRAAKLAIVIATVAGVQGAGFVLRSRERAAAAADETGENPPRRLSEVVFFLGCLLYGAGIWLVAQAFHLDSHYPDGVWWWAVGVLPFALCLNTALCHTLLVALTALWAGMEVFGFSHLDRAFLGWGRWPNGAYSLPLFALPALAWAYRKRSPVAVGLSAGLLGWWAVLQPIAWDAEAGAIWAVGGVGVVFLMLAEAHRRGDPLGIPYRIWGGLIVGGVLIPLSFTDFWDSVLRSPGLRRNLGNELLFDIAATALPFTAAAGLLAWEAFRRGLNGPNLRELGRRHGFSLALGVLFAGLALWSFVAPDTASFHLPPALLANGAMIALAVYLIRLGVGEGRGLPFAAGVAYLLLWTTLRYVDLFGEAGGMLGAAVMFFLCAAGLVAIARFWSHARAEPDESPDDGAPAPLTVPNWINRPLGWLVAHGRTVLIAAAVAQGLILIGMVAVQAAPLAVGQTVRLRVVPVDPRDLFRGDYVILNYELNDAVARALEGSARTGAAGPDRPVYVLLKPDADGVHHRAGAVSFERPDDGLYLLGRLTSRWRRSARFGIEAFYVQEGEGLKLERLRNRGDLSAEVAVAPWGQATLRRLIPAEPASSSVLEADPGDE